MSRAPIGLLGLGSIGLRHAENLRALGETVIAFDPSPEACRRFATELGGEVASRDAVLGAARAIVIASPNELHLRDLGDAIEAGASALVEKPLGHDAALARTLLERAERRGIRIEVAQNLRHRDVVRRARDLVRAGAIGQPVWAHFECASWLPDWRPQQDYRSNYTADSETGGVIFDIVHEFDLAFHLLGPAEAVAAAAMRTGLLEIESEDLADITLRHGNGCQTTIHLDYVTRPRRRHFTVSGRAGILEADLRTGVLRVTRAAGTTEIDEVFPVVANQEYLAEIREFLARDGGRGSEVCSAREALAVLEVAVEARRLAGLPLAAGAVACKRASV